MTTVTIPNWTGMGILPPINDLYPVSAARSPYPVSLLDIVMRFSRTPERHDILHGFLQYRAALHSLGYVSGFQWLNGSFMEHIEVRAGRPPQDLDVVTFLHDPGTPVPSTLSQPDDALDNTLAKRRFKVDAYILELDQIPPREITFWSAYWYSMWSHSRDKTWKGFLQIELSPHEDADAMAWLAQNGPTGAHP